MLVFSALLIAKILVGTLYCNISRFLRVQFYSSLTDLNHGCARALCDMAHANHLARIWSAGRHTLRYRSKVKNIITCVCSTLSQDKLSVSVTKVLHIIALFTPHATSTRKRRDLRYRD